MNDREKDGEHDAPPHDQLGGVSTENDALKLRHASQI